MADYIYTMEIRLTPDQFKGGEFGAGSGPRHGMNVYLTGGAIRES